MLCNSCNGYFSRLFQETWNQYTSALAWQFFLLEVILHLTGILQHTRYFSCYAIDQTHSTKNYEIWINVMHFFFTCGNIQLPKFGDKEKLHRFSILYFTAKNAFAFPVAILLFLYFSSADWDFTLVCKTKLITAFCIVHLVNAASFLYNGKWI